MDTWPRGSSARWPTVRWLLVLMVFGASAACIPAGGGGGGGDDDDGGEADGRIDPDDGIPPDMFVDPDDGVPPPDMFIDPDDGIPPADMAPDPDPDDGVPPPDMAPLPDGGDCAPETCNGADDDCDGTIDEGFDGLGEPCFVGVGLCEADGVVICTPDGSGTVCDAASPGAVPETCNGLDDDCDGDVDEALDPAPCESGLGRCAEGLEQCVDGEALCIPRLDPIDEVCSGEDDDCDGRVDEGQGGELCVSGEPGLCAAGVDVCVDGMLFCQPGEPAAERCNEEDDDCDGDIDERGVCDACAGVNCPPGLACVDGECLPDDPCAGVNCPPGTVCDRGECVPIDPGEATPIAAEGRSIELAGALTADDPLWDRAAANCAAGSGRQAHFDALRIVNASGIPRTITVTGRWGGGVDGFLHVFDAGFEPGSLEGCLRGDDDFNGTGASQVAELPIGPAQEQVIVVSTFSAGRTMPDYTVEVQTLGGAVPVEVCDDRLDNDGNGLADCQDPACIDDPACDADDGLIPGVQQDVALAAVEARGWRVCHSSLYSSRGESVDALLDGCAGEQLMLACRPVGAANLTLAAEGLRADVTFDVGRGANISHNANEVEWYLSPTRSWGFAPGGAAVNLGSCDFGGDQPELRMCMHLDPGGVRGNTDDGYRCGDNDLNADRDWERLVLAR